MKIGQCFKCNYRQEDWCFKRHKRINIQDTVFCGYYKEKEVSNENSPSSAKE